jgi:hypothetical protein
MRKSNATKNKLTLLYFVLNLFFCVTDGNQNQKIFFIIIFFEKKLSALFLFFHFSRN